MRRRILANDLQPGMVFSWLPDLSGYRVLTVAETDGGILIRVTYVVSRKNGDLQGHVFREYLNPFDELWVH